MSKTGNDASTYIIGAGFYYVALFIISVYPAVVLALWVVESCCTRELIDTKIWEPILGEYRNRLMMRYTVPAQMFGVVVFLVLSVGLKILNSMIRQTWAIVIPLYLFTFYPFYKTAAWVGTGGHGLWLGLNWVPWW